MSKDDKIPPKDSADSKDPKSPKDAEDAVKSASENTSTPEGKSISEGRAKAETKSTAEDKTASGEDANVDKDGDDADSATSKSSTKSEKADKADKDLKSDKVKKSDKAKKSDKSDKSDKSEKAASDSDDTDDHQFVAGERPTKKNGSPAWLVVLSVVILVVGVAGAVWQGIGYFQDRSDKNAASLRDEVIDVASQVTVNSLSFAADTIEEDQERLRADSTGEFLAQQDEYAEEIKQTVTDQGATTSAQISNAALSDIDEETGTATVLLVYTAQSEREELPPVSGRQAARVELIREGEDWKVAELIPIGAQVPVGESSESVQQLDEATGATGGGDDADAEADSDSESGSGNSDRSEDSDRDGEASPTSGAAATTAGGN